MYGEFYLYPPAAGAIGLLMCHCEAVRRLPRRSALRWRCKDTEKIIIYTHPPPFLGIFALRRRGCAIGFCCIIACLYVTAYCQTKKRNGNNLSISLFLIIQAFYPHLAACTSNAEPFRKEWIPCMICRPVNPAGFIGKSCKNPVRIVLAHVRSTCAPLAENPKRSDDFSRNYFACIFFSLAKRGRPLRRGLSG